MLQGGGKPLTMKASALTSDFHAISIKAAGGDGGGLMDMMMSPMIMLMGAFGGMSQGPDKNGDQPPLGLLAAMGLSWTTGETQSFFGQTYLVAYKLDMDLAGMAKMDPKARDFSNMDLRLYMIRTDAIQSFSPRPDITPAAFMQMLKGPPPVPAKAAVKTGK